MKETTVKPAIKSVEELLAHSLAMEAEASERYAELSDQMTVHNNQEVADLFKKLSEIEGLHVDHVTQLSQGKQLPQIAAWDYRWGGGDSPEAPSTGDTHYLMQPYHAISLALKYERRAVDFYADVARETDDKAARDLAMKLAEEEREHVRLLEDWLTRFPKPEANWAEDLDPPTTQE